MQRNTAEGIHGPMRKRLDFGGNPDRGIFKGIFYTNSPTGH